MDTEKLINQQQYIGSEVGKDQYMGDIETHSAFLLTSDIKIYNKVINIEDLVMSNFKKSSRDKTLIGLKGVVGEWGVVNPIHVLELESGKYLLLDGLRRVFARVKNGEKDIPAQVWDFKDKAEGKEKANIISLMINRSERYTAAEMWEQVQVLEEVNGLSPGLIEFLLQMHAGDVMKLKDVVYSELEFAEVKDKLFSGEYTIDGAYKKLAFERKKVNRLAKEDKQVIDEDDEEDFETERVKVLSDEQVKDLLDLEVDDNLDLDLEDMDKSSELKNFQLTTDRVHFPLHVAQEVLNRDDNKCRCCGAGYTWSNALEVRHIVPVVCGGKSVVDNGLTLCANCYITMQVYSFGDFKVDIAEVTDPKEREVLKSIFKYGNVAIEAVKRSGLVPEEVLRSGLGSGVSVSEKVLGA